MHLASKQSKRRETSKSKGVVYVQVAVVGLRAEASTSRLLGPSI